MPPAVAIAEAIGVKPADAGIVNIVETVVVAVSVLVVVLVSDSVNVVVV